MKIKLLVLSLIIAQAGWTQNNQQQAGVSSLVIGTNNVTQADIQASLLPATDHIYAFAIDTTAQVALVQVRYTSKKKTKWLAQGSLSAYDLSSGNCLWTQPMAYGKEYIQPSNGLFIRKQAKESMVVESRSGKPLYACEQTFIYIDPALNIGITYVPKSNLIEAIDLMQGKVLWSQPASPDFNLNTVLRLDKSHVLLVAQGLISIGLKNGIDWNFVQATGFSDYSTRLYPHVTGIASNVEMDSLHFYFASRYGIACISKEGKEIWTTDLPTSAVSQSTLFKRDSVLYMVNRGKAASGIRTFDFGRPFVAAFSATTGKRLFLEALASSGHVNDMNFQRNSVLLLQEKSLSLYSLTNGALITEQPWREKSEPLAFSANRVYQQQGNDRFESLSKVMPLNWVISTSEGHTKIIDSNLLPESVVDLKQNAVLLFSKDGYRFLGFPNTIIIVDKENKQVAQLDALSDVVMTGKTLFGTRGKALYRIDLSEVLK